ncbi:hypothetical protein LRA02_09440 [Lentilactobacillus rapi]|uniref:Uncharacterized protein n=1 Tax=Lentilactobacillus rapi TaxID=481723 RepID=A0A512PLJ3_9LACO|nr:hypothetical protein LRA02_09440 [Lentilactobacillus rapi]
MNVAPKIKRKFSEAELNRDVIGITYFYIYKTKSLGLTKNLMSI